MAVFYYSSMLASQSFFTDVGLFVAFADTVPEAVCVSKRKMPQRMLKKQAGGANIKDGP